MVMSDKLEDEKKSDTVKLTSPVDVAHGLHSDAHSRRIRPKLHISAFQKTHT